MIAKATGVGVFSLFVGWIHGIDATLSFYLWPLILLFVVDVLFNAKDEPNHLKKAFAASWAAFAVVYPMAGQLATFGVHDILQAGVLSAFLGYVYAVHPILLQALGKVFHVKWLQNFGKNLTVEEEKAITDVELALQKILYQHQLSAPQLNTINPTVPASGTTV